MSTITTRAGKGSPLTNNEVDANFTNLNTDKAELSGAAFTGAITTTSTVDGRDVATDGTKLDGIEASADVTDTTNVTAAGALMDSEVTNLAQVKAFDSADYATAAQGTTADAALPKSGGAMTGAITTNSTFDGRDVATDGSKLDGIEAGATADQTAAEIKTAYESNADTNAFTDADESKLDGIEASADVTDAINVAAAGGLMDSELTSIASVKALNQGVATGDSPTFVDVTATSLDISGNIDVDGTTNLDVVDIDGAVDMASTLAVGGVVTANAGVVVDNITIDGTTIALSSGDLTLDAASYLILDADGGNIVLQDNADTFGRFVSTSDDFTIQSDSPDKDIIFKGNDGGSFITALTLDMSAAGAATFNAGATFNGNALVGRTSSLSGQSGSVSANTVLSAHGGLSAHATSAGILEHHNDETILRSYGANAGSGKLVFKVGGGGGSADSEAMRIDSSGDLIKVGGVIKGERGTASAPAYSFSDDTDTGMFNIANADLGFSVGGTERMRIDSSGNVGIGTTSNTNALNINGSQVLLANGALKFADAGNAHVGMIKNSGSSGTGQLEFYTGSAPTERMRIDASGNVGIGCTPSPWGFSKALQLGDGASLATGGNQNMWLSSNLYLGTDANFKYVTSRNASQINLYNGGVVFQRAATGTAGATATLQESMRIDSSGRLGLGVTPEAWSSVFKVLRVGTGSSIAGESGGTSTWFSTNAYYDGSWKRINTNTSAQIGHTSDGKQEFKVAASGSAGGAISWNTAMTVDNSGNVLVGKTSSSVGTAGTLIAPMQTKITNNAATPQITTNNLGWGGVSIDFLYTGARSGYISVASTSVSYVTSSDQRLKENIADADDAGSKIDAIQVRKFDWKADGSHQDYGMIAQELQAVSPEAVSGDADSEEMMGVDYSKLVPMLIKEIQSLRNRVAQLEE